MSKGLEALDRIIETFYDKESEDIQIVRKELKALDIIKTKEINIHALLLHLKRFDSLSGYNAIVGDKYIITQEEYDLLKEVFYGLC